MQKQTSVLIVLISRRQKPRRFSSRFLNFSHIYLNLKIPDRFQVLPKLRGWFAVLWRRISVLMLTDTTPVNSVTTLGTEAVADLWEERQRKETRRNTSYSFTCLFFIFVLTSILKWSEVAQSCLTLCNPVDCSPPGSSVHGFSRWRILEWVTISFSRGSFRPRGRTRVSSIGGRRFNLWAPREAQLLS